jgi:hypothetical protein
MKLKPLLKSLLIASPFAYCMSIVAQQPDGIIQHDPSVVVTPTIHTIMDNGKEYNGPLVTADPYNPKLIVIPGCDTLDGSLVPNNGNRGIMFNLKATQMTRIDFFNSHLSGPGSGYIRLYARFGTCIGHESSDAGWSLIDSVFMNIPATGLYRIPIHINQVLHVNEVGGYYLTASPGATFGVEYTNGTVVDTLYNSNTTLKIMEGIGHGGLFDACCYPRVFTGFIEHCPSTLNACENYVTTYAGGNGNTGAMFNVSTNHDITIKGFSGAIVDSGYFKLYYRYGSYAGHQDSASQWVFVDSNYVVSAGMGMPTTLFTGLNLLLNANETMAFYVTATNAGGSVNYTDGTAEGNLFAYDGVLKFFEGLGKGYPFDPTVFSPRIFNGTINYCIVPGFIGIEENPDPEFQPSVYPVPTTGELFMNFKGIAGDREIIIMDMTGRICTKLNNQQSDLVHVDVSSFANGIYLYTVINKGQKEGSGKFIKQ